MSSKGLPDRSIRICADRGGTFCDVHAQVKKSWLEGAHLILDAQFLSRPGESGEEERARCQTLCDRVFFDLP